MALRTLGRLLVTSEAIRVFTVRTLCFLSVRIIQLQKLRLFEQENTASVNSLLESLLSSDLDLVRGAKSLIVQIAREMPGILFSEDAVSFLTHSMQSKSTLKLRVYEIIVKVAMQSDAHFQLCSSSGLLKAMVQDLRKDNVLCQLSIIELFTEVCKM